ncbi:MAG TPA: RluA family pseudouridine synthase [bacterium]|nr:RluA family pseudouridine synthase [bacterium]
MTEHHIYYVDAAHEDVRLDTFLTAHLRAHSRSHIKALIETGHITVDGGTAKPALHLRRGQRVEVVVPPPPPATVAPEDISLPVVFEDEHLLVINKPPALTVHPGAGRPSGTLVNAVLARVPGLARVGSRQRPGIVHRLDKDTSGLLVVAKTPVAYASLSSQVARRTVNRTYLALVHGVLPHEERTITAPIGRHPRHRTRMAVVPRGREAITRYRVLERLARYTLVEAHLVTGRTHQIRVHFAHIGHPVAGDPVYAGRPDELGIGRQALHAHRLQFVHPASGKEMAFEAPPPADFAAAVERARAQGAAQDRRKGRHR